MRENGACLGGCPLAVGLKRIAYRQSPVAFFLPGSNTGGMRCGEPCSC